MTRSKGEFETPLYCSHCGSIWPSGQTLASGTEEAACPVCGKPHLLVSKAAFVVEGLCCTACQTAVEKGLKRVNGVQNVRVSYVLGKAHVDYDPRIVNLKQIEQAIKNSGYRCIVQGKVQPESYAR